MLFHTSFLAFVYIGRLSKLLSSLIFGNIPYSVYMPLSLQILSQDPTAKETFSKQCAYFYYHYNKWKLSLYNTRYHNTFKERIVPYSSLHDYKQSISKTLLEKELFLFLHSRPFL